MKNSHKTQDFDDLSKTTLNLLSLRLLDSPGRCVGAERCLKRDLKSSRSYLTSKWCYGTSASTCRY